MKRKLNILIALLSCQNPDILFFDEPFTGLDVKEQESLSRDIAELKQQCSIVMVSHDLDVLRHSCDWIIVIESGAIQFVASNE